MNFQDNNHNSTFQVKNNYSTSKVVLVIMTKGLNIHAIYKLFITEYYFFHFIWIYILLVTEKNNIDETLEIKND